MSVEVWYGDMPSSKSEQETLLKLYQYLRSQQEHFVMLHNFFVRQSNEIDLVVLKHNGIFLAELKHVGNPVVGGREGDWKIIGEDGTEEILNPGRYNPFKQVQRNYYDWKEWCQANADRISAGIERPIPTDWTGVISYIVLCPDLPAGSRIDIGDWPVQAVGLPNFLVALGMCSSKGVNLSRQEMSRIPKLIGLRHWDLLEPTERLADWQPAPFAVLVARGHQMSVPLFRLDEIGTGTITVGREADNDLIINDPRISRHHARIYRRSGRWVVQDLGSTSGTYVSYTGDPEKEVPVQDREFALQNNSFVRFGPAAYTLLLYEGDEG